MQRPFWKTKLLSEMNHQEWESLCDGCGRCCLHKVEDEDTNEVFYTDVACRLLDLDTCRCTDYKHRHQRVSDCICFGAMGVTSLGWLPKTCAYRLLAEQRDLPAWHPLVSGDPTSVHRAGVSVRHRAVREFDSVDLELRIVHWSD